MYRISLFIPKEHINTQFVGDYIFLDFKDQCQYCMHLSTVPLPRKIKIFPPIISNKVRVINDSLKSNKRACNSQHFEGKSRIVMSVGRGGGGGGRVINGGTIN